MPETMQDTIVTMQFKLQQGKTVDAWLKANERVNAWIKQQPEFRFRSLSETADGQWILAVYWGTKEAAKAAEEKFRHEMEGLLMPFIDPHTFSSSLSQARVMLQG